MKTMIRILILLVVSAFSFISCMKDDKIENHNGEVVTVADGDFSTPLPVPPIKGMHRINNKIYDKSRIDETIQSGTTEIWEFDNSKGNEPHPMHIHPLQFQVIDRTGGRNSLIATEQGWKDTVLLLPGEKVRVIITFGQNKGKYVLHCHNLEHEDDGMMLQFEII